MEKFPGNSLAVALMALETIKCGWAHAEPKGDATAARWMGQTKVLLNNQEREQTSTDFAIAEDHLRQCGLTTSAETVKEYRAILLYWNSPYFAQVTASEIVARIEEIQRNVKREMNSIMFMFIPAERAKRYDQVEAFGAGVAANFPSAKFDIAESGNCFATARFTACVFHLMRALEVSLASFAGIFQVPADHTNWHNIIESLESKIRDMGKAATKAPDWKNKQEFYSQAASSFMFFKDAWRNYTAHARGKYTELEADTIYRNVGAFMQKLAEGGIAE